MEKENVVQLPKSMELSHNDAAKYIGISAQGLHNRNSLKRGPRSVLRFGRRKYLVADLDAFLKREQEVREAYR